MLSGDFDVVGVATDGTEAVEKAGQVNPDVIVMDVEMPGLDGFQALRALKRGGLLRHTGRVCAACTTLTRLSARHSGVAVVATS